MIAVLAGGASTRMGTDKAMVEVAGRTMLDRVLTTLSQLEAPVLIGRALAPEGLIALPDTNRGIRGPLAGLVTALEHASESVTLVAIDQPFLRAETVAGLIARHDGLRITVPFADGTRQVTCAVYPLTCLEEAQAALGSGGGLQTLLDAVACDEVPDSDWRAWGEDGRSWFSVDRPEDIIEGLARYQ